MRRPLRLLRLRRERRKEVKDPVLIRRNHAHVPDLPLLLLGLVGELVFLFGGIGLGGLHGSDLISRVTWHAVREGENEMVRRRYPTPYRSGVLGVVEERYTTERRDLVRSNEGGLDQGDSRHAEELELHVS